MVAAELPLPELALAIYAGGDPPPATALVRRRTVGGLVAFEAMRPTRARLLPRHTAHPFRRVATHVGLQNTREVSAAHSVLASGSSSPCEPNRLRAQQSHPSVRPLVVEKGHGDHDAAARRADDHEGAPPHPPSIAKGSPESPCVGPKPPN